MLTLPGISTLIFSPLYQGIQTYIMQRFDLEEFCRIVQDEKITVAYIVPPVALALAKSPVVDKYNIKSLRILTSAAAPAPRDVIQKIHQRYGIPTRQVYGLSEASPGVASQTLSDWDKPIGSTGRLAPNLSLKIMQDDREMQCGEEGELWIRGPNIFKGYYRDPRATTAAIDAEGWYRTGDIGYFDKHDNIFITDRLKELIKYNGYQVPPAQLEALLIGHPAVLDVAVVGVYSEKKATELPRAYIVLVDGHEADTKMEKDLHQWLNKQVVTYKRLRGGIRFVEAIPKSTAGKVLRRVLVEQAKKEQAAASLKSHL
jgi:4-coumarate--CoA ligase